MVQLDNTVVPVLTPSKRITHLINVYSSTVSASYHELYDSNIYSIY